MSEFTNPFLISRVDNPFQSHPDLRTLYEKEFQILFDTITEIKSDPNSQSRGVTIVGPPGSGKTHLAMRLANEILNSNRLLFIRQPNNEDSIYHHIYTRILESMVENVPDTPYSQLAYLLGKSFSAILIKGISQKKNLSVKDKNILEILKADSMNIFKKIGGPGTETRRRNWKYIESKTLEWWEANYGLGGYSHEILKAFIKYCAYSDPRRKQLIYRWLNCSDISEEESSLVKLRIHNNEINPEEFALNAMIVISRLSLADQPLVIIFDQLEGLKYSEKLLFKFWESIKELFTHIPNSLFIFNLFTDRWEKWQKVLDPSITERLSQTIISLGNVPEYKRNQILEIRAQDAGIVLGDLFSEDEIKTITSNSSIRSMLVSASNHFRHKTGGLPLYPSARSFEERMESEIKELKDEIKSLKKYLNMTIPTFREVMESEDIEAFFESKKQEFLKNRAQNPVYIETDDAGKILTIAGIFKGGSIIDTGRLKSGRKKLPDHVLIKGRKSNIAAGFLHMGGNALTGRLKNFHGLCMEYPEIRFYILRDSTSPEIKGKIAKETLNELAKLHNYKFINITPKERLRFQLIYEMVTAIQNRDLEGEPVTALRIARTINSPHFVFDILEYAGVFF